MANDNLTQWAILPQVSNCTNSPPLLFRHSFGSVGYTVQITNLIFVWTETLSHKQIKARAKEVDSVIDPEEKLQLEQLLQHLKAAFDGVPSSELNVITISTEREMTLTTISPLPEPLKPLRWLFYLLPLSENALRPELVMPLMAIAYLQNQQIDYLVQLLAEKDSAITKILDKLEASSTDMSSIFPHVRISNSNKSSKQRAYVLQHVKGLLPFDSKHLEDIFRSLDTETVTFNNFVEGAFVVKEPSAVKEVVRFACSVYASTFQHLERTALPTQISSRFTRREATSSGHQRQHTPPPLPSPKSHRPSEVVLDSSIQNRPSVSQVASDSESTADESEVTASPKQDSPDSGYGLHKNKSSPLPELSKTLSPPATAGPCPSQKKLGVIGRSDAVHSSDSSKTIRPSPEKLGSIGNSSSKTKNIGESLSDTRIAPRLGRIGGRPPMVVPPHDVDTHEQNKPAVTASSQGSPTDNAPAAQRGNVSTVTSRKASESPAPRETSEERAIRKREELKHQLEEKSKVQTKKRRRF